MTHDTRSDAARKYNPIDAGERERLISLTSVLNRDFIIIILLHSS